MKLLKFLILFTLLFGCRNIQAANYSEAEIKTVVDETIKPLLEKHEIPGFAVALTVGGKDYFFTYGIASKDTRQAVTKKTIFELGSISKTYTGTLASYAQTQGKLAFEDAVSKHISELRGNNFDQISLINLATYTAGGLPLQVPDEIENDAQMIGYYKTWKPTFAPDTQRVYSNPSIGLLGIATARSFGKPFEELIEKTLFKKLGLKNSFVNVPSGKMKDYAQGYNRENKPVRVNPGVIDAEAYGIKADAADVLKFLKINLNMIKVDADTKRAVNAMRSGYFKFGEGTQAFVWEEYAYPSELQTILAGNSPKIIFEETPVVKLNPPSPPRSDVWVNKTGSTNGFGAYVAFIPAKKIGIVLLANKNYPIDSRVTAAYQILRKMP